MRVRVDVPGRGPILVRLKHGEYESIDDVRRVAWEREGHA
jgi:hypothetical protein